MISITEQLKNDIVELFEYYDKEDRAVRERQIRQWRQLKFYWEGFTNTWYDEVAHDWRIWDYNQNTTDDGFQAHYDKPINIFKGFGESIIAALSVTVPSIKCYPDDAENPLDIQTAGAGDRICELSYRHNDAVLKWLNALFIYFTEGMVAAYNYSHTDEKYGTYKVQKTEETEEEAYICSFCQMEIPDSIFDSHIAEQFQPDDDDVMLQNMVQDDQMVCPSCAQQIDPNLSKTTFIVTKLIGETTQPKSRQCIDIRGGLYVKVANYAKDQKQTPYLIYNEDIHVSKAIDEYEELIEKYNDGVKIDAQSTGIHDPYERWARLSPQYLGQSPDNTVTKRMGWFRPWSYNTLDKECAKRLKKRFPSGFKATLINDNFAEAVNESLDDHWTLTHNPLSDFLHFDPAGQGLVNVQDITAELISLTLQTVEHGITQVFADPATLNFDQYGQMDVTPGSVYKAKAKSGKSLSDSFYELKAANLSGEVLPFFNLVMSTGQDASGAQPSIFGGNLEGSKTASEYSMSRAQALQRLQTQWKMLTIWWKNIYSKVIPQYIKTITDSEDEKFVTKNDQGSFINVFIRRSELMGSLGSIELEASENLPITWMQQRDIIKELLVMQNPEIQAILMDPANLPLIQKAFGMNELKVPGLESRTKQLEEIQLLLQSGPIEVPPDPMAILQIAANDPMAAEEAAQGEEVPSVDVDFELDDHLVEGAVIRDWLIGPAGRLAKIENPEGYKNCLLHFRLHKMAEQQQMMAQQAMSASSEAPPEKPNEQSDAPVGESADV